MQYLVAVSVPDVTSSTTIGDWVLHTGMTGLSQDLERWPHCVAPPGTAAALVTVADVCFAI